MSAQDELTATLFDAVNQLTQIEKAGVLFNTALALVENGRYGEEVEHYLDVYLTTPGLPKEDLTKALLARRKLSGKAQQDIQAVIQLDPLNRQARSQLRCKEIRNPACQRVPPEIWDQIAVHMHRHHLRTWLFVSHLHRDIASRYIFHTINICLGGDDCIRTLDILERAKNDPVFASHVKSLRFRWTTEAVNMPLDVMIHILKSSLPAFKALRNFEWIGYPRMLAEMVQALLNTHKHLHGLGLILKGQKIPAVDASAFEKLHKFTCLVRGCTNVREIRTVLDRNESSLKHLILSGFHDSKNTFLDLAFESVTIKNLVHLDLVHTRISHLMLTRIVSAHNLQSLTLHKTFVDPNSAAAVFASDRIMDGSHTLLPHLKSFRLLFDKFERPLYQSVVHFLRKREKLRRLDLVGCPWDLVQNLLPDLRNLRVLAIYIDRLSKHVIKSLVKSIPRQMVAIRLSADVSDIPLDNVAWYLTRFNTLSFLHLDLCNLQQMARHRTEQMPKDLHIVPTMVPSLDFLVWNDEPYVVVRSHADVDCMVAVRFKRLPSLNYVRCVDIGGDDAAWLEQLQIWRIY